MRKPSRDEVVSCRKEVRNRLGKQLARKSSNAFCVAYATATWTRPGPPRFIVELTPQEPVALPTAEAAEKSSENAPWSHIVGANAKYGEGASRSGVAAALREWCVAEFQERASRAASPIVAELRRGAAWELAALADRGRKKANRPAAEFCWLNQTIRTISDPRLLAELAFDDQIHRVDLPRRMFMEVKHSCKAMGAIAYRERSQHTGDGVKVAVIDSEVQVDHPAFGSRAKQKENFTEELWGNPMRHGTAIAGIIAGNLTNFVGMAPGAIIFNYKIFSPLGTGTDDFDGACALQKALKDEARIANCSWGTPAPTDGTSREVRMCDHAWKAGMTIVKSAGHGGTDPRAITSPGDAEGVIVVGATERANRKVMDYSSRGPTKNGLERPHLLAPGGSNAVQIRTCIPTDDVGEAGAGTSHAAAHVSGALALILEGEPWLKPDEQREKLLRLCDHFPDNDPNTHGAGFLSLDRLPPL